MHINSRAVALAVLALSTFTVASAGTVNLSTGLDSNGNLITADGGCDANWVQTAGPANACGGNGQIVTPGDADWYGGWVGNGPNSDWITSTAAVTANGSPLPTYQISFWLDDTTGAALSGSWTVDDAGYIALNGTTIGSEGDGNWTQLNTLTTNSANLVAGWNSLAITMTDSDNFLEGVRFEGSVTGDGASLAPEPGTLALFGLGTLGLGLMRRRKA